MNGITKAIVVIFCLGLMAAAGVGFLALGFLRTPASLSGETAIFEVRPGQSFKSVARALHEQGLITDAWKFELLARFTEGGTKVRVGEYALRRDSRPREVLAILNSGKSVEYPITIQEGFNRFEIAEVLGRTKFIDPKEFLTLTTDQKYISSLLGFNPPSLEGYLFPETYHITKFTGVKGVIKMMVDRFKENFEKVKTARGYNEAGLSDRELVILASIVEKETGAPEERGLISSVFHNRLKIRMPLQTDPTIIYGLWNATGTWNRNISRADLTTPGIYNTYLNQGLPPGPISNPGMDALKAAGLPEKSNYLFFVSRNNGTHVFSPTYALHQKAVMQFQMDRKAREGKSWRDLNKATKAKSP